MKSFARKFTISAAMGVMLTSCGNEADLPEIAPAPPASQDDLQRDGGSTSPSDRKLSGVVNPPKQYFDNAVEMHLALIGSNEAVNPKELPTIHLEFNGASVERGFKLGQSFLPCQQSSTISPSNFDLADKAKIIEQVQKYLSDVGITLEISDQIPAKSFFTRIIVGGSYSDLGCQDKDVLGIAPFDRGNIQSADLGFAFVKQGETVARSAEVIAHEIAHTLGIENLFGGDNFSNFFNPDARADLSGFASQNGLARIRSIADLVTTMDPTQALDISKLWPEIAAVLPGGLSSIPNIGGLNGIESILTVILMAAEAANNQNGGGATSSGSITDLLGSFLDPNNLQSSGISNLADIANMLAPALGSASPELAAILAIFQSFTGGAPSPGTPGAGNSPLIILPNFSDLLGLQKDLPLSVLFAQTINQSNAIKSQYSGAVRDALLSMLKVAYGQAYARAALQI